MSEIKLRAEEARNHANDVRRSQSDAFEILSGLRQRVDGLSDSFTGKAHTAFMGRLDEWKSSSDQLLDSLFGLGNFLTEAATTIEQTDSDLASKLGV